MRTIFFCKSVLETVKKFGWAPDIIIFFDWMSSLVPLYLKTLYSREPVFIHSKIIQCVTPNILKMEKFKSPFFKKILFDNISEKDVEHFKPGNHASMLIGANHFSDATIAFENKYDTKTFNQISEKTKKSKIVIEKPEGDFEKINSLINKLS